jgi:hypothetical protein
VDGVKGEKFQDRPVEFLDVPCLNFLTTPGDSLLLLDVPLGGPLGFEFDSNPLDRRLIRPDTPG